MKKTDFRLEVRLGLALIILVMIALNFASHYALFRVREFLDSQAKDELTEAAVVVTNHLIKERAFNITDSAAIEVKKEYNLQRLELIPMTYERVMSIQKGGALDSAFTLFDRSLDRKDLLPLLHNHPVYVHHSGNVSSILLFPAEHLGLKYIVGVTRENSLLGSVENAGNILIFFGIMGVVVIFYAALRLLHFVISPFDRLKAKAVETGKMNLTGRDEVGELIRTYERIITDLKEREEELRRLNEVIKLRAEDLEVYNNYILKSIQTGIITIDCGETIESMNRVASLMLNIDPDSANRCNYRKSLALYPELLELIEEARNHKEAVIDRDVHLTPKGNGKLAFSVSISPLLDSQNRDIGLSILLNDRTEPERLREELELNRRMASLGEMSGGLAHQLRNSTAAIAGLARLIDKKTDEISPVKENLALLLKEAKETSELVARFLDFARPLNIEAARFNLNEMLESIAAGARKSFAKAEISFKPGYEQINEITGDSLLLKQAIGNLVDNACKAAASEKGKVEISTESNGTEIKIMIADNGPGIPENIKDKIFTPFYSGSVSGSGLGLPLALKIIMLHGGKIHFKSGPSGGTVFVVILPASNNPSNIKSEQVAAVRS